MAAAAPKKPKTKSEIMAVLVEETGLTKKPAVKARKGINPFTGEEQMFQAKPASKVVKANVLKAVKDMV